MTGRLNRQYETRMRRAVNQQKEQVAAIEAASIVSITMLQDHIDNVATDVTVVEGNITTIEADVAALEADVAAIEAGGITPTTAGMVDTSSSATAWFTLYEKTTGPLGSGETLPAMTDVSAGKFIMYTLKTDGGGNFTLSGTMKHQTSTYTSAVFNDAGDNMLFVAVNNNGTLEWHIISYAGVTLS